MNDRTKSMYALGSRADIELAPADFRALELLVRNPLLWIAAGFVLFVGLYWILDQNRLHALHVGFDNGIFLQSLAHVGRDGSAFDWAEGRSHLFVHDSWLLLVLVPFVKAYPYQETLLAAQVLVTAGASLALYGLSRTIGVARAPSALLALAYLVSPSVQGFAYTDFSEDHLAPLLIFSLGIAAARRSLWGTLIVAQLLCGVKEDLILLLVWFGLAAAIWYDRRIGIAVTILASLNACVYWGVLAAHHLSPLAARFDSVPRTLPQDAAFLAEILAPFAFAPLLLRWRLLLALPLLAELFLGQSDSVSLARAGSHYTAPLVALCAVATALVLRERPALAKFALAFALIMALFFNTTVLHIGRRLYATDESAYANARALVQGQRPAVFAAEESGAWAVAAGDLNARIYGLGKPLKYNRPAWNVR
jgi:uncharacterized membrane protein